MLSSNGMANTITFFLNWVKEACSTVQPAVIMSDCDQAQLNALKKVYLSSQILLCIWHVLCTFWSHFVTERFQALWATVKSWVKTKDSDKFNRIWTKIMTDPSVPQSLINYFKKD